MAVVKKKDSAAPNANRDIAASLMDVRVKITVQIGEIKMPVADILKLQPGQMVALQQSATEPLKIFMNDKLFAFGEAVEINGKVGVRVTAILGNQLRRSA